MSTSTPGPYDPEFRTRAIEVVRTRGLPRAQVARDLGINVDTLRLWVRQAEIDAGRREGLATDERSERTRRRRENAVLKDEREILKKAARLFAIERATR